MNVNIREFCGDYALDIKFPDETVTLYFKSFRNALNVKRIIVTDNSEPNVDTVADLVEVVRCKDCKHLNDNGLCFENIKGVGYKKPNPDDFCSHGERKDG